MNYTNFLFSVAVWATVSLVIGVGLFIVGGKIQSLNEKVVQNLFHIDQFAASQNLMTALKRNNLNVSLEMRRTAYISFYGYTHDGKEPSQEEIKSIQTDADYLAIVNPTLLAGDFEKYLAKPLKQKKNLERVQLILFILLALAQLWIIRIGK